MRDEEVKKYMIEAILCEKVVSSIGVDNIKTWLPLIEAKVENVVKVTKHLDVETRNKVLGVTAVKIQNLIMDLSDAVRKNYSRGEDEIIRAIVNVLVRRYV